MAEVVFVKVGEPGISIGTLITWNWRDNPRTKRRVIGVEGI